MKRKFLFDYAFVKKEVTKYFIVVYLSIAFIISAFAQTNKDNVIIKGSSTSLKKITPPLPAVEAGYKKLVFNDDFNSISTIDVNGTEKPGYNWYVGLPFGGPDTKSSALSVSNSVLNLTNCPRNYNWAISSYCIKKDFGHTFRYGYFEAAIRFDPTLGKKSRGFPAWWSLSTYYSRVNKMFHSDHWAELDFFEAYKSGNNDYNGKFVGTVHDWADSSKIHYQNKNNQQLLPEKTDFNNWHTYGCLWMPGKVTWYFDGVALMTQYYSATLPPDPLPNAGSGSPSPAPAGTYTILDTDPQGMLLVLGSDPEWPIYVDWVRVWQAENSK